MAEIIEMPEPVQRVQCRVLYGDTDSGGVVYYAHYLRYFEIGRTEFMRHFGLAYRELEGHGFILPVVECYSRYKAPARYDDILSIETALVVWKKMSCRFNYRIRRQDDGKLLIKGYTVHAVVNREGKLTNLPEEAFARFSNLSLSL